MTVMDGQTGETFACVWDALMDTPAEAAAMRVRSDLLSALCDTVAGWDMTRAAAAQHLDLTGPRLDELLRGRISRFSIDDLIGIATCADLDVRVQAQPASARHNAADTEESVTHKCSTEERALLGEAFSALRRERGKAWIDACRRADERGKRRPGLRTAGIDEIKQLAR